MSRNRLQYRYLATSILLLALFPIIPWLLLEPLGTRYSSSEALLTSLGQITALVGTVLFALLLLLRSNGLIERVGIEQSEAINRMRNNGEVVALLLLVSHPLLMIVHLLPHTPSAAILYFIPGTNWMIDFGLYALLLLIAFFIIRICAGGDSKLQAAPQVLSTVLFLGTLHAFFIPSSLSESVVLQTYVLSLVSLALLVQVLQFSFLRKKKGHENTTKTISIRSL